MSIGMATTMLVRSCGTYRRHQLVTLATFLACLPAACLLPACCRLADGMSKVGSCSTQVAWTSTHSCQQAFEVAHYAAYRAACTFYLARLVAP